MPYQKYINDDRFNISRGLVRNASPAFTSGTVPTLSQSTTGTIWDINDTVYPWSVWDDGASILTVDRASASDAGQPVVIRGYDANWNVISESVALTNATGNATTQEFLRIFDVEYDGPDLNVGNIDVKVDGTTITRITAGNGQAFNSVYTVPETHTAYTMHINSTAQANADGTLKIFIRTPDRTTFRLAHVAEVAGVGGPYNYQFALSIPLPGGTDIDPRITTRSNNGRFTCIIGFLLIKNT